MQITSPTGLDQLKASNLFRLPETTGNFLVLLLRGGLLLCLVVSISLALFSAFSARSHWYSAPVVTGPVTRHDSKTPGPGHEPELETEPEPELVLEPEPELVLEPEPELEPTNISHIVFGIGASLATWRERSSSADLWWDPGTTLGFVWLDAKPDEKKDTISSAIPYRVSSYSSSQPAVRIARIVYESFKAGLPNVRWFVMGDDDTVFFAHNFVSVLGRYNHNRMYYIGANSESVEQDLMHAYDMAFGGGGFAVSYPLAARLVDLMDGCMERYNNFYGSDQRVWACVSELGVPLTKLGGFHQFDIRGNAYGLLAAHPLTPLVSLHHLDALGPMFPTQTHLDSLKSLLGAYRADPGRILQQSFCYDYIHRRSASISWGYTIQLYPSLVRAMDLQTPLQTFKTWRSWSDGPFTFNTRPMSSDPCQQPLVYYLDKVTVGKSGTVTIYKRFVAHDEKQCDNADYVHATSVQRIIVSSKKMDPQYWTKEAAPRRQCSEIKNRGKIKNGNLGIRIRTCKPTESITI